MSGGPLTYAMANSFYSALPLVTLLNLYGTTEVAADVTFFEESNPNQNPNPKLDPISKLRPMLPSSRSLG